MRYRIVGCKITFLTFAWGNILIFVTSFYLRNFIGTTTSTEKQLKGTLNTKSVVDVFYNLGYSSSTGIKTFKLLRPCIMELDPFFEEAKNYFLLLLLSNYGRRLWRSWLLELQNQLFIFILFEGPIFLVNCRLMLMLQLG